MNLSVLRFGSVDAALQELADRSGKRVIISAQPTLQDRLPEIIKILGVDLDELKKEPRKEEEFKKTLLEIGRADPKNGGDMKKEAPFAKIIATWLKKGTIRLPEDTEQTRGAITKWQHFIYNVKGLEGKVRDEQVKRWKTLAIESPGEMLEFVNEHKVLTPETVSPEGKTEVDPFAPIAKKVIAEGNGIKVYRVDNWPEAQVAFQRGLPGEDEDLPNWCVAPVKGTGHQPSYFKSYGPPYYMFVKGTKRIGLLHGRSNQFLDIYDKNIKDSTWKEVTDIIRNTPEIKRDFLRSDSLSEELFKKKVLDKDKLSDEDKILLMMRYVDKGDFDELKEMLGDNKELTQRFESMLLQDNSVEKMIKYAVEARGRRWPELERLMLEKTKKGESTSENKRLSHLIMAYRAHFQGAQGTVPEDEFSRATVDENNDIEIIDDIDKYIFISRVVVKFDKHDKKTKKWYKAFENSFIVETTVDKKTGDMDREVYDKMVSYDAHGTHEEHSFGVKKSEKLPQKWGDIKNIDIFLKEQTRLTKTLAEELYHSDKIKTELQKKGVYVPQFKVSGGVDVVKDSTETYKKLRKELGERA